MTVKAVTQQLPLLHNTTTVNFVNRKHFTAMNAKVMMLIVLGMALIGQSIADDDDDRIVLVRGRRPLQQILRPLASRALLAGRPLLGGRPQLGGPLQGGAPFGGLSGLGGANAAGAGNGAVIGNQAIGTGTGIANAGPGGFGIGVGVGVGVATPIGNFAFGDGQSISIGK